MAFVSGSQQLKSRRTLTRNLYPEMEDPNSILAKLQRRFFQALGRGWFRDELWTLGDFFDAFAEDVVNNVFVIITCSFQNPFLEWSNHCKNLAISWSTCLRTSVTAAGLFPCRLLVEHPGMIFGPLTARVIVHQQDCPDWEHTMMHTK